MFYTRLVACRDQRPANVAYYRRNRASEIARVQVRQRGTVELLRGLRERPCMDCGGSFEPHQMDFDHRSDAMKSFRLTSGDALLRPTAVILDEAAKCDVVCANCHRIRTWQRHQARPPCRPWGVALPGSEADELASTGDDPGSMSSRAVFRLRRALSAVRDGLRPSRSQHEAGCRHQDDRTSWYAAPTGRDREVRYRLCELSSPSNIPKTFGSDGAGVAQLVERQPSKLHVAGSSPVSRSNPPDSYESAACPCAVVASSVIGPSGSRPTISPRASSTTMTAAS